MNEGLTHMEEPEQTSMSYARRPWLAGLLSLLTPGLGHLYTGRPIAAIGFWLLVFSAANIALAILVYLNLGWLNLLLAVLIFPTTYIGTIIAAVVAARNTERTYTLRRYNSAWLYALIVLALAFVGPWLLSPWSSFKGYRIPTSAMENTLQIGDYFFADLDAYQDNGPAFNDVVMFVYPGDGITLYIKRCVAGPFDTVEVRDKQVFVNGIFIPDPETAIHVDTSDNGQQRVQPRRPGGAGSRDNFGPYVVPADSYFMLGDNRDNSYDSRYWGAVPRDLIHARAVRLYLSKDLSRIGMPVR